MISREFLTHFADLTPYQTDNGLILSEVSNVGWLSLEKTFSTGVAPIEFINKLQRLIEESTFSMSKVVMGKWRGTFHCPLCGVDNWEIQKNIPNIGNAEIWIPSINRKNFYYAASTWICHYVMDHKYLPPNEYIESILSFDDKIAFNADVVAFDLKIKSQLLRDGKTIDQEYQEYIDSMHDFLTKPSSPPNQYG